MLPALAVGSMITGTLMSAYGQYQGYRSQRAATAYNQAVLDANQRIDDALSSFNIRRIEEEGLGVIASQRAAIGASGITFSGSALDVFQKSVRNLELDLIGLRLQQKTGQLQTQAQKGQLSFQQQQAKSALPINIGATLLSGAGQVASMTGGK